MRIQLERPVRGDKADRELSGSRHQAAFADADDDDADDADDDADADAAS